MATKRAASIVAVSMVETLVLTKWDFHRHCDRQVLQVFKAHVSPRCNDTSIK